MPPIILDTTHQPWEAAAAFIELTTRLRFEYHALYVVA